MAAITDRQRLGYYSPVNLLLVRGRVEAQHELAERWQEEASQAAIDGNPARTRHIETMIARLVFGAPV